MALLHILWAFVGTLSFACLAAYIYLASRGDSLTVYSSLDSRMSSASQKIFLGLAAIGFLTCMFKGAEAMLYWMPKGWRLLDMHGRFATCKEILAVTFGFFGGIVLMEIVNTGAHSKFVSRDLYAKCEELEQIIAASSSTADLDLLEKRYEAAIASLHSKLDATGTTDGHRPHLSPDTQTIAQYQDLLALVRKQRATAGNPQMRPDVPPAPGAALAGGREV